MRSILALPPIPTVPAPRVLTSQAFRVLLLSLWTALTAGPVLSSTGSVSGRVWHDLDRNGFDDPGEPGLEGVEVQIETSGGSLVDTVTTGADGSYLYHFLSDGDFRVTMVEPSGFVPTLVGMDSDVDRTTARSDDFTVTPISTETVDAGLARYELDPPHPLFEVGRVVAGESVTFHVPLENIEPNQVTVDFLLGGSNVAVAPGSCGPVPFSLAPGAVCHLEVTASAPAAGTSTTISILFDTTWNPTMASLRQFRTTKVTPIYVDPDAEGADDGSSWADAHPDLVQALAAHGAEEYWLASDVERPSATILTPCTTLIGGFGGGEVGTLQRQPGSMTVFSGDVAGDDVDLDDNQIAETADDIVGTNLDRIFDSSCDLVLDRIVLTAADGASDGAAARARFVDMNEVLVTGNRGASAISTSAIARGGEPRTGIDASSARFVGNSATALHLDSPSFARIVASTFSGNSSPGDGGAIRALAARRITDDGGLVLRSVLFSGNRAAGDGGAVWFESASAAGSRGGTPFTDGLLTIERSTFVGNEAAGAGGALSIDLAGGANRLHESVLWGNRDATGSATTTASVQTRGAIPLPISSTDAQGSGGSLSWNTALGSDGGGNVDLVPGFLAYDPDASAPFSSGDFRLRIDSPLLDLGGSEPDEAADAAGASRVQGSGVDLGAFEGGFPGIFGRIWDDLNGDGVQDDGEPGVAGVTVSFEGLGGVRTVGNLVSDAQGLFVLVDGTLGLSVPDQTYAVSVILPDGYAGFSPADQTTEDLDSDADPTGTVVVQLVGNAIDVAVGLVVPQPIFSDGFEDGNTSAWN